MAEDFDLKITKQEPVLVRPAEPTPWRVLYLSNLDQLVRFPVNILLFYNNSPRRNAEEIMPLLKEAYAKVLVHYDFMAGRLLRRVQGTELFDIQCNSAGAVFVSASSELSLEELGSLRRQHRGFTDLVSYPPDPFDYPLPLTRLQVTRFRCGGFCVGLSVNHCSVDGISAAEFLTNFSAMARGMQLQPVPKPDRTMLKPRNPLQINFRHPEYEDIQNPLEAEIANAQPKTMRVFHLSQDFLKTLKTDAGNGGPGDVTTFEAVTAQVWRARTLALTGIDFDFDFGISFAVDVRRRMSPALPLGFTGNAVIPTATTCSVAEMRGAGGLGGCAWKIREATKRIGDEYVRSCVDMSESFGCSRAFGVNGMCVSAWWKLGFYDADFGWGRPQYVCPLMVDEGCCAPHYLLLLAGGASASDGIDVYVTLPRSLMDSFSHYLLSSSLP